MLATASAAAAIWVTDDRGRPCGHCGAALLSASRRAVVARPSTSRISRRAKTPVAATTARMTAIPVPPITAAPPRAGRPDRS
jgi:hypothetical protein